MTETAATVMMAGQLADDRRGGGAVTPSGREPSPGSEPDPGHVLLDSTTSARSDGTKRSGLLFRQAEGARSRLRQVLNTGGSPWLRVDR